MDSLVEIFGSRARAEIFRLLFERTGVELYLREIQRRSGLSISPIQEEIFRLRSIGLLTERKDGNRCYYAANTQHPLFPEVRGLVEKTSGVRALLQSALKDPEVQFAFIFGSVAAGDESAESDLDLFVIGDLGLRKLTKLLSGLSDRVGREINPHCMTAPEFSRRIRAKDHFISSLLESKMDFLIGDEDELRRLGKKRVAKGT